MFDHNKGYIGLLVVSFYIATINSALPETDLKCLDNEKCIKDETCQQFIEEREKWNKLTKGTPKYTELLTKLQGAVCNKDKKGVCCEKNPAEGRFCLTGRGDSGTCQTFKGCSRVNRFFSATCGKDYTCCKGKEEEVIETNDVIVRSSILPTGHPDRRGICGVEGAEEYVFGGTEARDGQFPFVASLVWTSKYSRRVSSFCGGVLITSRHILTAAHCFNSIKARDLKDNSIDVRIGITDLQAREKPRKRANIARIKKHENYRRVGVGVENDIAIVTLDRDVNGAPVCLPTEYRSWSNRSAVIVGWGRTSQDTSGPSQSKLRYANLQEYSVHACQRKYDRFLIRNSKKAILTNKQLCAGNEMADACAGDSGGPLLHLNENYLWMVAGIVSFGPSSCAREVPGVYTKVASYIDWINKEISA